MASGVFTSHILTYTLQSLLDIRELDHTRCLCVAEGLYQWNVFRYKNIVFQDTESAKRHTRTYTFWPAVDLSFPTHDMTTQHSTRQSLRPVPPQGRHAWLQQQLYHTRPLTNKHPHAIRSLRRRWAKWQRKTMQINPLQITLTANCELKIVPPALTAVVNSLASLDYCRNWGATILNWRADLICLFD